MSFGVKGVAEGRGGRKGGVGRYGSRNEDRLLDLSDPE